MERAMIIKRSLIGFLCLAAIALIILNICLYTGFKRLARDANRKQSIDTVQKTIDEYVPVVVRDKKSADEIADLDARLAATEEKLDEAYEKWADITAAKEDEKKKEREQARGEIVADINIQVNSLSPLFTELKISSEKIEKYRDLCLDCTMALNESRGIILNKIKPGAEEYSELTEAQKAEYKKEYQERRDEIVKGCEAKYKDLLGDDNYARIVEYEKTGGARFIVSNFKSSLGSDEMLTKDQEKALIKIVYNEQTRASNEITRDSSQEPFSGINDKMIAATMNRQEKLDSRITQGAKDILSSSQLEKLTDYMETQREETELRLKSFKAANEQVE